MRKRMILLNSNHFVLSKERKKSFHLLSLFSLHAERKVTYVTALLRVKLPS